VLLRVEFRGRSEGPTIISQRYAAIRSGGSSFGWQLPD
jgi:hypothetical protein